MEPVKPPNGSPAKENVHSNVWKRPQHFKVLNSEDFPPISNDCLTVKLHSHSEVENIKKLENALVIKILAARDAVLCGGPWFIGGHVIGLDGWSPSFSLLSMNGLYSPIWIRLPYLPLHCWDER
ncbi:hypothetical protein M5K25_025530 [Dendrobium thyrsiflorum]|uniref:DUF4283 domain-containing protein n=1 Tax=Dendrobium thyrsiflorum TaxID=117978 RepID=A0ABD0U4K8_DENTH